MSTTEYIELGEELDNLKNALWIAGIDNYRVSVCASGTFTISVNRKGIPHPVSIQICRDTMLEYRVIELGNLIYSRYRALHGGTTAPPLRVIPMVCKGINTDKTPLTAAHAQPRGVFESKR